MRNGERKKEKIIKVEKEKKKKKRGVEQKSERNPWNWKYQKEENSSFLPFTSKDISQVTELDLSAFNSQQSPSFYFSF